MRHLAEHAAADDDFVALGERLDHRLVLLLPLHLRPDHDEVQHHEHQHQRQHAAQGRFGAAAGGRRCGLGKGFGNEHVDVPRVMNHGTCGCGPENQALEAGRVRAATARAGMRKAADSSRSPWAAVAR